MFRNQSCGILLGACALGVLAWTSMSVTRAEDDPRVELARKLPNGVKPEDLRMSPVPGVYEIRRGAEVGYVSADGRYYFSGELHDLKSDANLTEQTMKDIRKSILASVPESEMMIFGAASPYTITVFTDIDCGYCRKLHSEIAQYNQLGIRVRYMFYPRSGPGTPSWKEAENVWCAPNRNEALTRAKHGDAVPERSCRSNPVGKQYQLGSTLGIQGTPGIFTSDGDYLKGYLPPSQMLAQLQRLKSAK